MGFFDDDAAETAGGFFGDAELPTATPGDEGQDDVPDFVLGLAGKSDAPETAQTEAGFEAQGAGVVQTIGGAVKAVSPMIDQFKAGMVLLDEKNIPSDKLSGMKLRARKQRKFRESITAAKETKAAGDTFSMSDFNAKFEGKIVGDYRSAINDYTAASQEIASLRPDTTGQAFLFDVLTMVEQMVPSLTVGAAAGPNAGLGVMFGQVYVNSLADVSATNPELSYREVQMHGVVRAGIETLTEKLPFDILMKRVGWSGVKKMAGFTVAEGLQEGASSLLQSAWDKGTIDPDKTMGETLREAGYETLLGAVGAPIIASPFIVRDQLKRARQEEKFFDTFGVKTPEELLKTHQGPQPPKAVRAAVTKKQEIEARLKEAGEASPTPFKGTLPDGSPVPISYTMLNDQPFGEQGSVMILDNMRLKNVKGEIENGGSADWTNESVKIADSQHFRDTVRSLEESVRRTREELGTVTHIELIPLLEQKLVYEQRRLSYYQNLQEHEMQVEQQAHGMLNDWIKSFMPGSKFIFSTNHAGEAGSIVNDNLDMRGSSSSYGQHWQFASGEHVIEINLDAITDENGVLNEGNFVETLTHEFGHALVNEKFRDQPNEVKAGLVAAYQEWLTNISQSEVKTREYFKRRKGMFGALSATKAEKAKVIDADIADLKITNPSYQFGFTEFVADSLARGAGTIDKINAPIRKYFNSVGTALKEYWGTALKEYQVPGSYKDFIDYLAVKATLDSYKISQQEIAEEYKGRTQEQQTKDILMRVAKAIAPPGKGGSGGYNADDLSGDLDKFGLGSKLGLTLLQLRKRNGHIAGLRDYTNVIKSWWNTKMTWASQADERLKQWQKLGNKRGENFGKFLLDLTVLADEKGQRFEPSDVEFLELAEQYEFGPEEFALFDLVDQDFRMVLTELQDALIRDAERNFAENPDQMQIAINQIQKEVGELKNSNFFPLSRFGQFFIRVTALRPQVIEGQEFVLGDVTSFETFETKKAMKKRLTELGRSKLHKAVGGKMNDMQRQFAGFPPQFISMLKERLNLTEAQDAEMSKLLHDLAPGQSFKKHLKNRKNVAGYSLDAMRGYANYFMHFSNHVARIKYKGAMLDAIEEVNKSAERVRTVAGEATKRDGITQFLNDHYDYIMNPEDEWANMRALGFLWYIGFSVKSAVVNLTQVPLVTLPYLGAKYGDAKAAAALTKSYNSSKNYWLHPERLGSGQHAMLHALKKSGIIDESIATELAGVSEGSLLQRTLPGTFLKSERAARWIRTGAGQGAAMFQMAEKLNRRVTALAAYDLAVKAGKNHAEAVEAAQESVESTQFEYARWNRPAFMRGKKSIFFLFWQYLQNSLFFVANDPGASRYILMLLLMGGLSGLPFAEDLMDLFDYTNKKLNKGAGSVNVRRDLQQFFAQLGMNPDLMMHGSSRYMFGLPAMADAVGIPLPNVDMSGSLSMGRIIPGIEPLLGREGRAGDTLSRTGEEMGGAVLAMPLSMSRAIMDDNPNTLKRFEKAMPTFAQNFSKAYRYATEGDKLRDGSTLVEFDMNDTKHQMEIWGQAMGFAPTRAQIIKEQYYMTKEIVEFYELRRRSLLKMYDYARQTDDAKMEGKVLKEITKYNDTIPFPAFTLTGTDIARSLKDRGKKRSMNEAGFFAGKKGVDVQDSVGLAFPEDAPSEAPPEEDGSFFSEDVK